MYNTRLSPLKDLIPALPEGDADMANRPLTCPFCRNGKNVLTIPENEEFLYWCDEHGGTCGATGYMLVRIEAGEMSSQANVFGIMYEALTGEPWDGDSHSPMVEYRLVFHLQDGYLTDEMPEGEIAWGVMFMRLSQTLVFSVSD